MLHETKWAASGPGCFILHNEPPVLTEKEARWTLENKQILSLSETKALFLSCVDPNLDAVPTTLSWLPKNLKMLQNYLYLTDRPFYKSKPPSPHLFILILPLKIPVHYDRGISIYVFVANFSSRVSRQSPEMQFGAVQLEARNNTQSHNAVWTS